MTLDDKDLKRRQLTQLFLMHLEDLYSNEGSKQSRKKFRVGHLLNALESLLELSPEAIVSEKITQVFSNIMKNHM